jgi:hypothetical protein
MYSKKTYLLIKSLSPMELFQVLSNGKIDEMEFRKDVRSEWYLHNWEKTHNHKIETLNFHISETGFEFMTNREQADFLKEEYCKFTDSYSVWFGGQVWRFGFTYNHKCFEKLYQEWNRNKILEELTKETNI